MSTFRQEGYRTGSCSTCMYCTILPAIFSKPDRDPFFVAPECNRGLLTKDSDGFDGKDSQCGVWKPISQESGIEIV